MLMSVCGACQAQNPDSARFCNQCGARLDAAGAPAPERPSYTPRHLVDRVLKSRSAIEGERKRVTVLFADIKGSTKLAEQAGAETWHTILDRFFSILSAAVHRFEGTVNQYTGDGIMALFGAPIAHEDHAQRACMAALAMQNDLRQFADELRLKSGLNISMRVGLNTGEVIVGRIGDDLRMDYTAQGLTVNLAARMEHICEPGRIYATRNTAALVEGYFKLRDLGEMAVAGASAPVRVYEVEGEGHLKTRLSRSLARGGGRFIGRERELTALRTALARACGGEGAIVSVIGNAGIGKSRLCHEFTGECERAGIVVHRATGVPYASALPLFPVQTLLRSRLGLPENCPTADIRRLVAGTFLLQDPGNARLLPQILDFLGAGSGQATGVGAEERGRLFELLARYLPDADAPQILLVEDMHFADAASEEFFIGLLEQVRGTRTLLLFNYRPDYVSEWLAPHLDEQVAVSALSAVQLEELAHGLLGGHPSLEGIAQGIRQRASGNPFFVEEAVQALEESGHLEGERGAYVLARPIAEWPIPDTVHALIAARIDRLHDDTKRLLHTAAVIGQEFNPGLLANLVSLDEQPFEAQLAVLEDSGFVHQKGVGTLPEYAFCHPLTQEVAYTAQLETQRATVHARLARLLEADHPLTSPPDEQSIAIAHHWRRASEWARAGAWNLHAARWAGTRDSGETLRQFRQAWEHFDRTAMSAEVLKGRIAARSGVMRMVQFAEVPAEEVERAYREGRALADECGDVRCAIELMMSYSAEHLHRGDAEGGARLATESLELARGAGAGDLVHRFRLAYLLAFNAAGLLREGIARIGAACGDDWRTQPVNAENYMSRGLLGLMLCTLGELDRARGDLVSAVSLSLAEDRAASWMHANLVEFAWFSGETADALNQARLAVLKSEQFGSPFFRAVSARALAQAHILNGDYRSAIPFLEQTRSIVAPGGFAHQFEGSYLSTLATAYAGAGDFERAEATALEALNSAQRMRARQWEMLAWLALFRLPAGRLGPARVAEGFARLLHLIDSIGAEGLRPHYFLARGDWADNDTARAEARAQALGAFQRIGASGHVKRLLAES
jgi:adenylate cyclase